MNSFFDFKIFKTGFGRWFFGRKWEAYSEMQAKTIDDVSFFDSEKKINMIQN
jgi:hypothetical protein